MSPLLRLYIGFSQVSGPIWRFFHRKRLKTGKELPERLPEKYGIYSVERPDGPLLWFHALSVGESLALVPLIELALKQYPTATVILTTSTSTSVEALDKAGLPERAHHLLLPIDTAQATRAFLDHWRPDIAAFAELDFWPRLMIETHRRDIPVVLVNSRMPSQNFERRKKLGGMTRDILRLFDRLLVQDDDSAARFAQLGADRDRIDVLGALKAAARPLPADEAQVATTRAEIGDRPVWLAAATEGTEHEAMIKAHEQVLKTLPDALLIVAPRFPQDAEAVFAFALGYFANVARRSDNVEPDDAQNVYIADTIGEMGLWYRLAPVSFLGHSLNAGLEGKNPFEAAALGSAILYGPYVNYFSESYAALEAESGAQLVTNEQDLATAIVQLQKNDARKEMNQGASRVIDAQRNVLTETWAVVDRLLSRQGMDRGPE